MSRVTSQRIRLAAKTPVPAGRLKCGLLGAGDFFHYAHAPALNRPECPLGITGVWARQPATFAAVQRHLRYAARHFTERAPLLGSGIEAALILLPNRMHFDATREALDHGLHVYCEKPLALTVADARLLAGAQSTGRTVLMNGFNQRFFHRHQQITSILAENQLGPVTRVQAFHNQDLRGLRDYAPLHREATGGGVLLNAGIHLLNLLLDWFGPVARVRARFQNLALPVECGEDTATCELWFHSGVHATLTASLANAADTTYERIQIQGHAATLETDFKRNTLTRIEAGKPRLKIPCRPEIMSDSVAGALQHFHACIRDGQPPETGLDDFIRTLTVVEALTLAAQQGDEVNLPA